jgi:hypothetical protein
VESVCVSGEGAKNREGGQCSVYISNGLFCCCLAIGIVVESFLPDNM